MKINTKQEQTDTETIIYIESSYKCVFKVNETKSGYLITITEQSKN